MKLGDIIAELKKKPGRHLTVFLILHEVTAILSFPLVYPFASLSNKYVMAQLPSHVKNKVDNGLEKANGKVNSIRAYFGYPALASNHPLVVNVSLTYVYVKLLMPVRLAISFYITPTVIRLFRL